MAIIKEAIEQLHKQIDKLEEIANADNVSDEMLQKVEDILKRQSKPIHALEVFLDEQDKSSGIATTVCNCGLYQQPTGVIHHQYCPAYPQSA